MQYHSSYIPLKTHLFPLVSVLLKVLRLLQKHYLTKPSCYIYWKEIYEMPVFREGGRYKKKIYKLLDSAVYVTPKMVESPLVSMNFDLSLLIQEYIYLVM